MKNRVNIIDALNILYTDVVNNSNFKNKAGNSEYEQAKDFLNRVYEELNVGVMEFLAMFMLKHPNGKIRFMQSNEGVGLVCDYDDICRLVVFNQAGVIVKDQKTKGAQEKGE